jgi:hypothetical protein
MLLELGTTTYGSFSALSGLPSDWWKAVSSWNQGSVAVDVHVSLPEDRAVLAADRHGRRGLLVGAVLAVRYLRAGRDLGEQVGRADRAFLGALGAGLAGGGVRGEESRGEQRGSGGGGEGERSGTHVGEPFC